MSAKPENKTDPSPANAGLSAASAALSQEKSFFEPVTENAAERDQRLDRLPLQLDVMVRVRSFRVGDLLALAPGVVLETTHDHGLDVPVRCGNVVLIWAEFEVLEQKLGVRITRVA